MPSMRCCSRGHAGRWHKLVLPLWIYGQLFALLLPTVVSGQTCSTGIPHPPVILRQVRQQIFYDPLAQPHHEVIRCPVERTTAYDEDTELSWWFTNSSTGTGRTRVASGMELRFTPLNSSHVGEYVCEAKNNVGLSRSNVFHVVEVTRTKSRHGAPNELKFVLFAGQSVSLDCPTPDGNPTPKVSWQLVSGEPCEQSRSVVDPRGTLHIPFVSVDQDNGAVWHCIASQLSANEVLQIVTLEVRRRPTECVGEPRWLYLNKHVILKKGEDAELFCIASGPNSLNPQWDVNDALKAAVRDSSTMPLRISSSTIAATGRERFSLNCTSNGLKADIILSIQAPPAIIDVPNVDVLEGEEFVVDCEARGTPAPNIEWNFNGEHPLPSGMRIENKHILKVDSSELRHKGILRCTATNVHGTAYRETHIMVYSRIPQIIAEQRCFTAVEGDTVVIPCSIRGQPQPQPTWWRDEKQLKTDNLNYSLELVDVRKRHRGTYSCRTCNITCVWFEVILEVLPAILEKMPPKPLEALESDSLRLECVPKGSGPAGNVIQWFVNGSLVHQGEIFDVKEPLQPGTYSCQLNNGTMSGADLWEAELRVLKRPSVPQIRAQCKSGKVILRWKSAAREESILWYDVQRRPMWNESWQSIHSVQPETDNDKTLYIEHKLPNVRGDYTFRVVAYNRAGSNSSAHTQLCSALTGYPPLRNPYGIKVTRNGDQVHISWKPLESHERNGVTFHYELCAQTVATDGKPTIECHEVADEEKFTFSFEHGSDISSAEFTLASVNEYGSLEPERFIYDCAVSISNFSIEHVSSSSARLRWSWNADEEGCVGGAFNGVVLIRQRLLRNSGRISRANSIHEHIEAQGHQLTPTSARVSEQQVLPVALRREQHLLEQLVDQAVYCVRLRATFEPAAVRNDKNRNDSQHRRCSLFAASPVSGQCYRTWESSGGELCFYPSAVFEELDILPTMELRDRSAHLLAPPPNTELFYYKHSSAEANLKSNQRADDVDRQADSTRQWLRSNTSVKVLLDYAYSVRLVQLTAATAAAPAAAPAALAASANFATASATTTGVTVFTEAVTGGDLHGNRVNSLSSAFVDGQTKTPTISAMTSRGAAGSSRVERVCRMSPTLTLNARSEPSLWLIWLAGVIICIATVFITLALLFRRSSGIDLHHERGPEEPASNVQELCSFLNELSEP